MADLLMGKVLTLFKKVPVCKNLRMESVYNILNLRLGQILLMEKVLTIFLH